MRSIYPTCITKQHFLGMLRTHELNDIPHRQWAASKAHTLILCAPDRPALLGTNPLKSSITPLAAIQKPSPCSIFAVGVTSAPQAHELNFCWRDARSGLRSLMSVRKHGNRQKLHLKAAQRSTLAAQQAAGSVSAGVSAGVQLEDIKQEIPRMTLTTL